MALVGTKQRACRVLLGINGALIVGVLGMVAVVEISRSLRPLGSGEVAVVLLFLSFPVAWICGAIGFIVGRRSAGRFLVGDNVVTWKLSVLGAICVGVTALLGAWYVGNSAAFLLAIVETSAWAALPYLLKVRGII